MFSATDMFGTVAFFSGSSGRPNTLNLREMVARRLEILVVDQHLAALDRPLAGKRLDQFALPVAGDAGDADDLAAFDLQVEVDDRLAALVALDGQARRSPASRSLGGAGTRAAEGRTTASPIIISAISRVESTPTLPLADLGAAPQHAEVVAERLDLAELVGDHHHRDLAAMRHVAQQAEDLVGLARRQHRGRLVQDEEALVEIEQLEDFELLLLARRQRS